LITINNLKYNHNMKKQLFFFSFFLALVLTSNAQKVLNSWVSPEYSKPDYRKVAVLAKITDKEFQQMVEDNAVLALREKGITAITSYLNFKQEDLSSHEALISKADQLQVDAVVVFSVKREDTKIQNTPTLSAGIGIPVRIGFLHTYIGGSVPLAGGSKLVDVLQLKSEFYNRNSDTPHWNTIYEFKLKNNYEAIAKGWTTRTVDALFSKKIL
jgi:hypothetical protein